MAARSPRLAEATTVNAEMRTTNLLKRELSPWIIGLAKEPDATVRYADAEAKLFRRAKRFNDGQKEMSCDQIIVQHFTGNEENVVIFESGGKRRVGRVRLFIGLQSESVATTANFSEAVELLDADDEKRLTRDLRPPCECTFRSKEMIV
ncbi:MAG: hypothetical protein WAM04_20975 [Candidatus Sulfotelmatobacter sp.]